MIGRIINRLKFEVAMVKGKAIDYYRNKGVVIGKNCEIIGKVSFGSEPYLISIGENVKITDNVRFITHDGGMHVLRNMYSETFLNADLFGKITVGSNVFLGNCVIVLPGVTIGDNVVIGAGAIVTKDIPSNSVAAGVPCKVIRAIDKYYEKAQSKCLFTKGLAKEEKEQYLFKIYDIKRNKGVS
jgi:acetyltransferase-like isoleucine patch superfamily enzyme